MADTPPQLGTWCHIEISGKTKEEVQACRSFYSEIFGWKFQDVPDMSYVMYEANGGIAGGLHALGDDAPGHHINYVLVDEIEASVEAVEKNGGRVVVPKQDVHNFGSFTWVADPAGNVFGLWQGHGGG